MSVAEIKLSDFELSEQSKPDRQVNPSGFTGTLPELVSEPHADRMLFGTIALFAVLCFFLAIHRFWVPATPGPDQNGYLVGGKNFAQTFSTGFKPSRPYAFVGKEWIEANGRYFPKYPLGLSVLDAIALKLGGVRFGVSAAFMINPIAMALAMLAVFALARLIVGSFFGLMSMLMVSTSPVCIGLTNTPSSHAVAICLVSWGFYLLFRWWQISGIARAVVAGFLIGSAVTIRYTEGMLILPILIVVVLNLRKDQRQSWMESVLLLAAWSLPVIVLATYNWFSMHHLTGYDATNESTGFTWSKFQENWEIMLRELYNTGLFFTLPITLLGSLLMFRWNWRISLVIAAWTLPNLLLYTCYYWAPDGPNISYLRFVLTIFPALVIVAGWAFRWIILQAGHERTLATIGIAMILAVGCSVNLNTALASSEIEMSTDRNLLEGTETILKTVPSGSMIFSTDRLLNYLQLVGDYNLTDLQQFDQRQVQQYANVDLDAVTAGIQAQRALEIYNRVKGLSSTAMIRELQRQMNQLVSDTLTDRKRVYFILPYNRRSEINRLPRTLYTSQVVTTWEQQDETIAAGKPHWLGVGRANVLPDAQRWTTWQIIQVQWAPPPPKPVAKAATTRPTVRKVSRPISASTQQHHSTDKK